MGISINSAMKTPNSGGIIVNMTGDIGEGEETVDYVLYRGETVGLAPTVEAALDAWIADGGEVGDYVPPPPHVPSEISPSQLFLQLHAAGFITEQEALDAATAGAVPAAIDALFATLPAADALAARIRWARMTTCLRTDPLVAALAAANSLTEEQVDQFFIDASAR